MVSTPTLATAWVAGTSTHRDSGVTALLLPSRFLGTEDQLAPAQKSVHYHIDWSLDSIPGEALPVERGIAGILADANNIAYFWMDLQEAVINSYRRDHDLGGSIFSTIDTPEGAEFGLALHNPVVDDTLRVVVTKCEPPVVTEAEDQAVTDTLKNLFGEGGASFAVFAVDPDGTVTVHKTDALIGETDAYGTVVPPGVLGQAA